MAKKAFNNTIYRIVIYLITPFRQKGVGCSQTSIFAEASPCLTLLSLVPTAYLSLAGRANS